MNNFDWKINQTWNFKYIKDYDVAELKNKVLSLDEAIWRKLDKLERQIPHFYVQPIFLMDFPMMWDGTEYPLQSYLEGFDFSQEVQNIITDLENHFDGRVGRVLLLRLDAYREITLHVDAGYYLSVVHRCHIPLHTMEGVDFIVGDEKIHMKEGQCYEINNRHNHMVSNDSPKFRIHLLIDIIPNTFL